jgi:hypothetical protein
VLEPGAIATAIWEKGHQTASQFTADHPARALYGTEIDGLIQLARKTATGALPADQAARIAIAALLRKRAPARVLVGRDAKMAAVFRKCLPLSWFDALLARQDGIAPSAEPAAVAMPGYQAKPNAT